MSALAAAFGAFLVGFALGQALRLRSHLARIAAVLEAREEREARLYAPAEECGPDCLEHDHRAVMPGPLADPERFS